MSNKDELNVYPYFTVAIVFPGESYGREKGLINKSDQPLIEFYDSRLAGHEHFDPQGQFINRYYAKTLLDAPYGMGLTLDGGNAKEWSVDSFQLMKVQAFIYEKCQDYLDQDCQSCSQSMTP